MSRAGCSTPQFCDTCGPDCGGREQANHESKLSVEGQATYDALRAKYGAIAAINEKLFGPATSFSELPRDEKQTAYELANDGYYYGRSVKLERRLARNHKRAKWIRRHSQIKAAAKARRLAAQKASSVTRTLDEVA